MKNVSEDIAHLLIDAEALYEDAPCGYCSFRPDGTIIKINRTLLTWLGFTSSDVVGQLRITDLFSKGGRIYYEMFYYPLVQMTGVVKEISFDIFRKDGTSFPALLNANVIRDKVQQIIAINSVVIDITDRKKYESELLNAKKFAELAKDQFEFVSNYIPEMIWTATPAGEINYVNKRFADYLGIEPLNNSIPVLTACIHPDDRLQSLRGWVRGIRAGKDFQIQLRLRDAAGIYKWYLLKSVPYPQTGAIVKWLGSCLDIHAHVMEVEQKDEFISVASHELRTPVTGLKLSLQLLSRMNSGGDKQTQLLDQASKNVRKIAGLIDDLLNVDRLKTGQLPLNRRSFSVRDMLRNCCAVIQTENEQRLEVSGDNNHEVFADENRIEQVVLNLIGNALKYAPASKRIILQAVTVEGMVEVSVTDQGPGIAKEKVTHLFERYYRADHSGVKYSGLGLGLYISSEIVKKHGGMMGVESEPGVGSRFWFTIPVFEGS